MYSAKNFSLSLQYCMYPEHHVNFAYPIINILFCHISSSTRIPAYTSTHPHPLPTLAKWYTFNSWRADSSISVGRLGGTYRWPTSRSVKQADVSTDPKPTFDRNTSRPHSNGFLDRWTNGLVSAANIVHRPCVGWGCLLEGCGLFCWPQPVY